MTTPATVGDNQDVVSFVNRAKSLMDEQDALAEDLKELWAEAKGKGHDTKALKAAVKEIRKPIDTEFKAKVNSYIMVAGQYQLFHE